MHPFFEGVHKAAALFGDLVFNIKNPLSLVALLPLKLGDFFLKGMLLLKGWGLATASLKVPNLVFGIVQLFLRRYFHVLRPFVELVPGLDEVAVVLFQVFGQSRFRVAAAVCFQVLYRLFIDRYRSFMDSSATVKELFTGLLVDCVSPILHSREEQILFGIKRLYTHMLEAQPTRPPLETLHHRNACGVPGHIEEDFGGRTRPL